MHIMINSHAAYFNVPLGEIREPSGMMAYVGIVMDWRTEQPWQVAVNMATREVGRNKLTSLELSITTPSNSNKNNHSKIEKSF